MPRVLPFVAALGLLSVLAGNAAAHAVGAEARLKDGQVEVDAYFDDDTPADDAAVVVTDTAGGTVATGRTNGIGRFSFPAPEGGEYRISVDAGGGHRVTVALTVPAKPAAPDAVVSGGPTRGEFTGPMKFVWAAVGLAAIGFGTRAAQNCGGRPASRPRRTRPATK